jgi:hypothetical protein
MFNICLQTDGTTFFDGETDTGGSDAITGAAISLSTWHHLAFSWDGAVKHAYVDGCELLPGHSLVTKSSLDPLSVGIGLDGFVDDVVFYTRQLAPAELAQLAAGAPACS